MKAKNILMTLLLVTGAIAAKASGFPPELALVSQPVMVYNYNSVTVYYDVENIGDYTYRGNVCIYLDPDDGFSYAEKYVKVRPGRIKRIAVEIPSYSIDRHFTYTIMPYYTIGRELYSFTTFEYFEPIRFCWHGSRTEPWVVIHIGPRVRYYHRPGTYRYYYDGFRPPMPPHGHPMPPMDPFHHTYGYHHSNGGYPATHNWSSEEPKPNSSNSSATVRPNNSGSSTGSATSGSMSSGNANTGNNSGSVSNGNSKPNAPAAPRNDSGSVSRPSSGSSSSGRTGNSGSSRVNNNSNSSRPSSGTSTSGRTGNSNVNRSSSSTNRSGNSSNSGSSRASSSSSSTRSSGTSTSSTTRSSSSSSRSSSGTSSRSGSANSGRR
ncbi:MAG: hypothetical protein IKS53_03255 [Bacteroidales bacterium]|nr:hypothetical protein [Bacteroidales bacterium]